MISYFISSIIFFSETGKLVQIQKKQCELFASIGDIKSCLDKAKVLLQRDVEEITLFTLKVLLPFTQNFDGETLEMVFNVFYFWFSRI